MDAAQTIAQSLGNTIDICLLYLLVTIGSVLLAVGFLKFMAWISDRRKSPPSSNGRAPGFEPGDAGPTPAGGSEEKDGPFRHG